MNRARTHTAETTTPTILVVDDDADTCRNMADLFGDLGYAIETAEDGDAALEKARQQCTIWACWTCGCPAWMG